MAMFSRSTIALLVLGALAAVVAVDMSRDQGAASDAPRNSRGAASVTASRDASADLAGRLKRERLSADLIGEPFVGREAPSAAAVQVPSGPPPFPYRYAGQFRIEDGGWRVYLLKGNDLVLIKVGDVLEGSFKVTAIGTEEFEVVHLPSAKTLVLQYASLGTGSTLAQGESAPLPTNTSVTGSSTPGSLAGRAAAAGAGDAGSANQGAALFGAPGFAGSPPAPLAPSSSSSSGSVRSGPVPSGQLGSSVPGAGAPRLGVTPSGPSSMPMSPAPAGVMQTLPAPTGRLGV